eukprot:9475685-Pyramimonas_sp.AAC.1
MLSSGTHVEEAAVCGGVLSEQREPHDQLAAVHVVVVVCVKELEDALLVGELDVQRRHHLLEEG